MGLLRRVGLIGDWDIRAPHKGDRIELEPTEIGTGVFQGSFAGVIAASNWFTGTGVPILAPDRASHPQGAGRRPPNTGARRTGSCHRHCEAPRGGRRTGNQ